MSLLSAWALAGLVLSVPLVLLHLRRNRPPLRDVASLLAWRELPAQAPSPSKRLGRPPLPLVLALQLLALALLVLGLARPVGVAAQPKPSRIYVVDESVWMQAREHGQTRIAAAQSLLRAQIERLPGATPVRIVGAAAAPRVLFDGSARAAVGAVGDLHASYGAGDLRAALSLAAGLSDSGGDRVELIRAPEDAAPAVHASAIAFTQALVGGTLDDQGLSDPVARCALPAAGSGAGSCEVFARVFNTGAGAREDRVLALEQGRTVSAQTVAVPGGSSSPVAFVAPAGAAVELELAGEDALMADNSAFVAVPPAAPVRITLVGNPSTALPLARALASVPDVELRLRTTATYRSTDPQTSDLLVLDGWLPPGGLPAAPSLLLVAPPRLPGGRVAGTLSDSRLSGTEAASSLLEGVELASLTVYAHGARRTALPSWMAAVAWSPEGPLLAAGSHGGQRVALLAFDPSSSNLPQLSSFPILAADIVAWSQRWAPTTLTAGRPFAVQEPPLTSSATLTTANGAHALPLGSQAVRSLTIARPGLATVRQSGPWGTRSQTIAVNVQTAAPATAAEPIVLAPLASASRSARTAWWPWVLAGALAALLAAIAYEAARPPRAVRA